jgi:hypothetical protein
MTIELVGISENVIFQESKMLCNCIYKTHISMKIGSRILRNKLELDNRIKFCHSV